MKPSALIAEDEPLLAESLKQALARAWPELEIVGLAANGPAALELAAERHPDVLFLDIRMPGMDGLEVAAELADRAREGDTLPAIVFVTAYDEYALKAFEHAALDYLLKPVDTQRLAITVERLKARLAAPPGLDALVAQLRGALRPGTAVPTGEELRTIRASVGAEVRMIPVASVLFFQAADKYTRVVTHEGEALIRLSIRELAGQLPAGRFQQIHRGTIVNLDEVASAQRDEAGRVRLILRAGTESLAVSRIYADLFRQM